MPNVAPHVPNEAIDMPRLLNLALSVIAGAMLTASAAEAQRGDRVRAKLRVADSAVTQIVKTRDGSTFVGRIVAIDSTSIRFVASVGTISIPVSDVEDVREVSAADLRNGQYWFPNPNATRLLFAPTGRMLEAGEGYFSDYEVLFPGFAYGVTDRISLGGGMSLIPGISPSEQLFYFTPKVGLVAGERVNVAAGALVAAVPFNDDAGDVGAFGILYAVGTIGGPNGSLTGGLGYGYADDGFADRPVVMLGAEQRLSRRTAFVTENYVLPGGTDPVVSYALRFMGEKLALDLGFVNVLGEAAIFPGFPYVGFVFNF